MKAFGRGGARHKTRGVLRQHVRIREPISPEKKRGESIFVVHSKRSCILAKRMVGWEVYAEVHAGGGSHLSLHRNESFWRSTISV